ncbi:hypothetical protein [Shewanella sp. Isolate13]|uniref:hypothetical protein n=1 Tax=Shewanella sp. Isolate13 TaxID=2908531 RepID=UPI0031F30FBE
MGMNMNNSMSMDIEQKSRRSKGKALCIRARYKLLSLSYLLPCWGLLLWLNFHIEPQLFAHFIAIPSLLLLTGYSAHLIARKGG